MELGRRDLGRRGALPLTRPRRGRPGHGRGGRRRPRRDQPRARSGQKRFGEACVVNAEPLRPLAGETVVDEFELVLPAELSRFGRSTRATVTGPADGPVVIVLGGISASRFVWGAGGWWPGLVGDEGAVDPRRHRGVGIERKSVVWGKSGAG